MAIEKVYLDPNAAAYTDNEIVGKVNTASANISRANAVEEASLPVESATFQKVTETETTKLAGIDEGAEVNPAATEIRDSIVGLADDDRQIVVTRPTTGQKKIYAVQGHSDGKTEVEQSDTAES